MKKFEYEPAPLVLAFVLGPLLEDALRQSLIISEGDPMIFFSRPISATLFVAVLLLFLSTLFPIIGKKRRILHLEKE
jgi:putative tricarboxylic transport membrane protein